MSITLSPHVVPAITTNVAPSLSSIVYNPFYADHPHEPPTISFTLLIHMNRLPSPSRWSSTWTTYNLFHADHPHEPSTISFMLIIHMNHLQSPSRWSSTWTTHMNHLRAPSTDLHLAVQELRLDIHQDQLDCNMELASLLHAHVWLAVSLILRLLFTMHVFSLLFILSFRFRSPLFDIAMWLLPFFFSYPIRSLTCLPRSTCFMLLRVPRTF
jgi:hypothetical protein